MGSSIDDGQTLGKTIPVAHLGPELLPKGHTLYAEDKAILLRDYTCRAVTRGQGKNRDGVLKELMVFQAASWEL